jgi:hypothetical protein
LPNEDSDDCALTAESIGDDASLFVPSGERPSVLPVSPAVASAVGIGRLPWGSVSGMAGSLFVLLALRVGTAVGCVCLFDSVGSVSTLFVVVFGSFCFVAVFFGWAVGGAGMLTYAVPELPDPIDPPSPSPRNAFTVNPTRCPAALDGTASTALHDDPEQALSADILPTIPDWVVATSYD